MMSEHGLDQAAYGLVFRGLPSVIELPLAHGPVDVARVVTVDVRSERNLPPLRPVDHRGGTRVLADGRVLVLDRRGATATFHGPPLRPELLAHPYLAPVATTFSRWLGHEVFHAGAVVLAGRAWGIVGPPNAGSSTLLAALAGRGIPVLCDDIMVTDGTRAFAGPRCIDLRNPAATVGLRLQRSRLGSRWRVRLPGGDPSVPLGGWVFLDWADRLELRPVSPHAVIGALGLRRAGRDLPSDLTTMRSIAALPAWQLRRPRDWACLDPTVDVVIDSLGALDATHSPALAPVPALVALAAS